MIVEKKKLFNIYKMIEYQKAPYLELDHYKAPQGIKAIFIPMKDGKKIRLAYWKDVKKNNKWDNFITTRS